MWPYFGSCKFVMPNGKWAENGRGVYFKNIYFKSEWVISSSVRDRLITGIITHFKFIGLCAKCSPAMAMVRLSGFLSSTDMYGQKGVVPSAYFKTNM